MSTSTMTSARAAGDRRDRPARAALVRLLYPALAVGALWGVALTVVELGYTTTPDGHPYRHTADYWLVGLGIPLALSALVVVHAVHALAAGHDGARGRWGAALFSVPMVVFTALFVDGLVQGESSSWGPTYLLCVLCSHVALALLVAGLWRTELLPRGVLALWFAGWFLGGPLSPPAGPLLLAAAYVVLAVQLRKSSRELSG